MGRDVLLSGVIPGPPQAEPGIQRLGCYGLPCALFVRAAQALAGGRLDSGGSALRAVRVDVKEACAVRNDVMTYFT